jgi:hypothetical protein
MFCFVVRVAFFRVKLRLCFATENIVVLVLASWFVDIITEGGTYVFTFRTRTAFVHRIKFFNIFIRIIYGVIVVTVSGNAMYFLNGMDVIFILDSHISSITGVGVQFPRLAFVSN